MECVTGLDESSLMKIGPSPENAPTVLDRDAGFAAEDPIDTAVHAALARIGGGFSPAGLAEAWFDWAAHLVTSPMRLQELGLIGATEFARLAQLAASTAQSGGDCEPCERALPQDKRFRGEGWRRWPYALYAEGFLAAEHLWDEATRNIHGATKHHLEMLRFVGRQALDTIAPSNFIWTNPEVVKATIGSCGSNLARGANLAWNDLQRILNEQRPEGADAYVPGKTVAVTKGRVIRRTELAEIIQYDATTSVIRPEPVVIISPWIMKYYILDLRPDNSLVKYLVDQGYSVFIVSWRNPNSADRDIGFDDYRRNGVMPAISAALEATRAKKAHVVGYCIGGTLLAATAAAMARDLDNRLQTLTLLAAQTDFSEAGELGLFVDESQLAAVEDLMWEQGTFSASQMAGAFHLLRSNDLIWSRMVRQYLLGQREPMTDVSAWSSDATRLPRRMHCEYLKSFYLNNDLAENRFTIDGHIVSLKDIRIPTFAVGAEWDHVAPWRSVHKIHHLVSADVTFALTNGGHNQGILSPPGRVDRRYRLVTTQANGQGPEPNAWFEAAAPLPGSWWPAWVDWLASRSGPDVAAPATASVVGLSEAAPGAYVHG